MTDLVVDRPFSAPRREYLHIRIRRSSAIALVVSVLLHLLLFWLAVTHHMFDQESPASDTPFTVALAPVQPKPPAPAAQAPAPVTPPVHKPAPRKPTTQKQPSPPPVMAVPKPAPQPIPQAPAPQLPAQPEPPKPEPKPALDPSKFPDMASYLKAMRERRGESGDSAQKPSESDARDNVIQRNLKMKGTNGLFHINSMSSHSATFTFRGWQNEISYAHRETYQVDAATGEDLQRLIVRKMIEIIRRYYQEDFNWESPRLGRVIVLSARQRDNDELEDFLIKEFFGPGGVYSP